MYIYPPVSYIEPLFRPPSEANSLILQVTNGCSWNQCTFCDMYTARQKKFRPKPEDEVLAEIDACAQQLTNVRRVFLADGDAMALSTRRLKSILQAIQQKLPSVTRVSAYCLPRNLRRKSEAELAELKALGLGLLYIGAESGDDQVLQYIQKGETYQSTLDALLKVKAAGIKTSVMIINGMGGVELSQQHALSSARFVNAAQPDYLATLVLFFRGSEQRVIDGFDGKFTELAGYGLYQEMETFIGALELEKTVFRSDHVSNSLVLKGVLGRDKELMLKQIRQAVAATTAQQRGSRTPNPLL